MPVRVSAPQPQPNQQESLEQLLSQRYDELNRLYAVAEVHLKSIKPTIPAWVPFDFPHLLGLQKLDNKWRLVYAEDLASQEVPEFEPTNIRPIVDCPVEVRVQASHSIRLLYKRIHQLREESVASVEAAITELAGFCKNPESEKGGETPF